MHICSAPRRSRQTTGAAPMSDEWVPLPRKWPLPPREVPKYGPLLAPGQGYATEIDANSFEQCAHAREHLRVWVETSYYNVYLCYWPSESREEKDLVRLQFRTKTSARDWFLANMTDGLCQLCYEKKRLPHLESPYDQYCGECAESMRELHKLEERYKLMLTRAERERVIYDQISTLRTALGDHEYTDADKAAVLDRLLLMTIDGEVPPEAV